MAPKKTAKINESKTPAKKLAPKMASIRLPSAS